MWAWETTPASVAHGILDDETYDWVVRRGRDARHGRRAAAGGGGGGGGRSPAPTPSRGRAPSIHLEVTGTAELTGDARRAAGRRR